MRLDVAGSSYDAATAAYADGRAAAGATLDQLTTGLSRTAGMGGDDATSEDFVDHYDEAAQQAVAALGDLVAAFDAMAQLTDDSITRHRHAETRATLGRAGDLPTTIHAGRGPRVVLPEPPLPPSALGGDAGWTPHLWDLVVDHLQGWAWPGADTDRLRTAATLWSAVGHRVAGLQVFLGAAREQLADQRSPEVPLALSATADLRAQCDLLGEQCVELGRACRDYADQVDATRDAVVDLLEELAVELAATAAVSAALSFFTLGGAAVAGAAAAAARVVTVARRIERLLETLRFFRAAGTAARTLPQIRNVRSALEKYRAVRAVGAAKPGIEKTLWSPGPVRSGLTSEQRLLTHFADHASDFPGTKTPGEYVALAKAFMRDPPPGTWTRIRQSDGAVLRFHPETDTFGVMTKEGTLQTFYKPDPVVHGRVSNWDYFVGKPKAPSAGSS